MLMLTNGGAALAARGAMPPVLVSVFWSLDANGMRIMLKWCPNAHLSWSGRAQC